MRRLHPSIPLFLFLAILSLGLAAAGQARPDALVSLSPGQSSLVFVENVGQYSAPARFRLLGGAGDVWLAEDAIWLTQTAGDEGAGIHLKITFPGSRPRSQLQPFDRLATRVSFFRGADPAGWQAGAPAWGGVRYRDLYPGLDLEMGEEDGRLALRLVGSGDGAWDQVAMRVEGASSIRRDGDHLLLSTAAGDLTWPLLTPSRDPAPGAARIEGDLIRSPFANRTEQSRAAVAPRSTDLVFSRLIGGSGDDEGYEVALADDGAVFVAGYTRSGDFPTTPGSFDPSFNGNRDAFVAKILPDGSLGYVSVLGGSNSDWAFGLDVDAAGNAHLSGNTNSTDFPTTAGALDRSYNGGQDVFVAKLDAAGGALLYSTYLGGSANEVGDDMVVDAAGMILVTGGTVSSDFPTT
ncbi:MAG: SBBP repeat-containing protein, partial [Caldilineales bacterium]|nr:SBBP repeat-containing protein [Caldilineales bacterium]